MFPPTRHSVFERLRSHDESQRELAWQGLVEAYWKPVYKYLRARWRVAPADAEELTQELFARAFEKRFFEAFDPSRARFRTWLRVCVDGLVGHERQAAGRLKRGGGLTLLSLDFTSVEGDVRDLALRDDVDPDAWFQQEFTRELFARAVAALRRDLTEAGRHDQLALFEACDLAEVGGGERPSYRELAEQYGLSVTDVTNRLAAARRRFRGHVLALLRETCVSDEEYESEARALFR